VRLTRTQRKAILLKARAQELIASLSPDQARAAGLEIGADNKIYLAQDYECYVDASPMKAAYLACEGDVAHNTRHWTRFLDPGNRFVAGYWHENLKAELGGAEKYANDADEALEQPLTCEAVGVFGFARIIELDPARVRYLIDYEFQSHRPGFTSVVMRHDDADRFLARYGGLYHFYRQDAFPRLERECFESQSVITRGAVSVRYPIPHKRGKPHHEHRSDRERMRAKLVLPVYPHPGDRDRIKVAKYDGFVAPTRDSDDYLLWLMEIRGFSSGDTAYRLRSDFATLYSTRLFSKEADSHYEFLVGGMLTQSQDAQRFPVMRKFVMFRLVDYEVRFVDDESATKRKSDVYRSGHFALVDRRTGEFFNERQVTREDVGFILDGKNRYSREHETSPLTARDAEALRLLQSPMAELFLNPEDL
jgi:hypothetical protein